MEQKKSLKKSILTEADLKKITQTLTKKEVLSIMQRKFDITVPDYENMTVKEIIAFVIAKFDERYNTYSNVRGDNGK